jgi:hypothetical protein
LELSPALALGEYGVLQILVKHLLSAFMLNSLPRTTLQEYFVGD